MALLLFDGFNQSRVNPHAFIYFLPKIRVRVVAVK